MPVRSLVTIVAFQVLIQCASAATITIAEAQNSIKERKIIGDSYNIAPKQ